jgi:iron complex outermembrane receptor protein
VKKQPDNMNLQRCVEGMRGSITLRLFLLTAAWIFSAEAASADDSSLAATDLSLEQLVNLQVTSVSRKEEKLNDAPAAISVLSNDDLHRSGATSVPEALRMVPGLEVTAVNSSDWAITSRGFNSLYANKLLVLVDGRAVYSPLFAGVFWDLQQQMLDDVDRIEVIRGPGGTMWGANAVNGVINVVSKSAKETQGALAYAGGGDPHFTADGARYGGKIGENTYYRIFGSYQLNDNYPATNGPSAHDSWQGGTAGFRMDHYFDEAAHVTWQGDVTENDFFDRSSDAYNVNTLGRWRREFSERSSLEAQAYYDRTYRNDALRARTATDTFDISAQHTFGLGARNDVIWGLGYRYIADSIASTSPYVIVLKNKLDLQLFNFFVQDEFKVVPDRFTLTAGTKIEHNDVTGIELQPSFRATIKPSENQTIWAAISRAVRTPDAVEANNIVGLVSGPPFVGPGGGYYLPTIISSRNAESEVLWAYELGYRIQPVKRVSVDLATFYNDYTHLFNVGNPSAFIPGTPYGTAVMPWQNNRSGHTYGGELSVTVSPADWWRFTASYSLLQDHALNALGAEMTDPQQQTMLRSSWDITKQLELDAQLRYVDQFTGVRSYVTADVHLSYRPTSHLELSLVGQNLFQPRHLEQAGQPLTVTAEVPRGFYARATLHF